jgi:hypothetical protein
VVTVNGVERLETHVVRRQAGGPRWLRVATFAAILAGHVALFALFPAMRAPFISLATPGPSTVVVFVPLTEPAQPTIP